MNNTTIDLCKAAEEIHAKLAQYEKDLHEDKHRYEKRLKEVNVEYVKASEDGDRSENAAFSQALKDLAELSVDLNSTESQISAIERCREGVLLYKHGTMITEYTTVHLKKVGNDLGKILTNVDGEYVLRIYPYGISQNEDGILSTESVCGKQLLGKKAGDEIKIKSKLTGDAATYRIAEFY